MYEVQIYKTIETSRQVEAPKRGFAPGLCLWRQRREETHWMYNVRQASTRWTQTLRGGPGTFPWCPCLLGQTGVNGDKERPYSGWEGKGGRVETPSAMRPAEHSALSLPTGAWAQQDWLCHQVTSSPSPPAPKSWPHGLCLHGYSPCSRSLLSLSPGPGCKACPPSACRCRLPGGRGWHSAAGASRKPLCQRR